MSRGKRCPPGTGVVSMASSVALMALVALVALMALMALVALMALSAPGVFADKTELTATRIKGRPAKLLHQAMYAKDGRLGFLHDVDDDGHDDFVYLVQEGSKLSFRIMGLLDDGPRIDVPLGKGYPAGLGMIDLDDDEGLEYIAAYGSRRDRLAKKTLLVAASVVTSVLISAQTVPSTGWGVTVTYVGAPEGLDLQDVVAIDDDGSMLWHRDLREKNSGGRWNNVRFRMLVPLDDGSVTIVLSNNAGNAVLGLSGADGSTQWSTAISGEIPVAKWSSAGLVDDGQLLPVLFHGNELTVLDPRDGHVVNAGHYETAIAGFPIWNTFGEGEDEGFLVFGDGGNELSLVALDGGRTGWSRRLDDVRKVVPLDDESFLAVWRDGIRVLSADGETLLDRDAPMNVKTKYDPVFRDVDGDGSTELVFVSGKKVVCWNPHDDRVLWKESLASFVGGANPVALYDAFYDLNGDGWLDVPAATGGGAGRWLSGRTGEVILAVGAAFEDPLVGDWDGDGYLELFWWNNWHEIRPTETKK